MQAYLSGVPNDGMLILDLNTDAGPLFQLYDSYYGKPFAWVRAKKLHLRVRLLLAACVCVGVVDLRACGFGF